MRKEDKITINGNQLTVKELTVAEVRHWMMDMVEQEKAKENQDLVSLVLDQNLFEDIGLGDILRMTDLQREQLYDLTPSQLQTVVQKCKGLNGDFFGMRRRLLTTMPRNA